MEDKTTSLRERARAWIKNNVPAYTQAQYEALLETNERLALHLISIAMDYEALLKAYHKLEGEVYRMVPAAPFRVEAYAEARPWERVDVVTVEWTMDRLRSSVSHSHDLAAFTDVRGEAIHAHRRFFEREVAPKLWEKAEACLARALAPRHQ